MRIAYFVNRFPLVSETFILGQIAGMMDRGHEITIFATGRADSGADHPLVKGYRLLEATTFRTAVPDSILPRLPAAFSTFAEAFRAGQLRPVLRTLDARRFGRGALAFNLLLQARPFVGQRPFDILHCQFGDVGPAVLRLRRLGLLEGELVVSFRGWDTTQYPTLHPGRYAGLFSEAAACLPVSESLARRLVALGCPAERIHVLRSGIDLDRFRPRPAREPARPAVLMTVGRLNEKKGIEYGLRAARSLIDRGYELRYRIVGDGPLHASLRSLTAELGLDSVVSFLGAVSSDEVIGLLADTDVFMSPSVTSSKGNQEGIPNALKEAMAVGVPVVGTRHGGIPELVEDERSGLLVDERDVAGLATSVGRLLEEPRTRETCVTGAREAIEAHYEIGALNDELASIYGRLVAGRATGCDAGHTRDT